MEVIFGLACIMMHVALSHSQGIMDLLGGMGPQTGPFTDPAVSRLTALGNLSPSELAVLLSSPQNQAAGAAGAGPMDAGAFPGAMGMGMGLPGMPGIAGMPMGMMEPSEMMEAMAFMGGMGAMGGMGPMGGMGAMGLGGAGPQSPLSAPTLVETTYVIPESRTLSQQSANSGLSALQLLVPQRQTQALLVKPSSMQPSQTDVLQRMDQQRRLDIILQARQALMRNRVPPGGEGAAEGGAGAAGAGGAGGAGGGEIPGPGERSMAELLGSPVPSGSSRGRGQMAVLRAPVTLVANVGRGLARSDPLFRPGASAQNLELASPRAASPSLVWGYQRAGGPDTWQRSYPTCTGLRQSPINIRNDLVTYTTDLDPFNFVGFDGMFQHFELQNFQHTLRLRFMGGSQIYVSGGGLDGFFIPAEIHFHWGSSNRHGSEHAINGIKFPLESHLLFFNSKYGNQSNAMMYKDGLAVMATFYLLEGRNDAFTPIEEGINLVRMPEKFVNLNGVNIGGLLPWDTSKYFRYYGSLTTPPCLESVTWTVFDVPQKISHSQLAALRKLRDHPLFPPMPRDLSTMLSGQTLMMDNYRPLQLDNGRPILTNVPRFAPNMVLQTLDRIGGMGKPMARGKVFKKKREAVSRKADPKFINLRPTSSRRVK